MRIKDLERINVDLEYRLDEQIKLRIEEENNAADLERCWEGKFEVVAKVC